jgi:hypothetical protein
MFQEKLNYFLFITFFEILWTIHVKNDIYVFKIIKTTFESNQI